MPAVVTKPQRVTIVTVGQQGPRGIQGPAGGATLEVIAGEAVGGHRVVSMLGGAAYHTDPSDPVNADSVAGISTVSAAQGGSLRVVAAGDITEPSWSWSDGPIYCGAAGVLTQTVPVSGAVIRVGIAMASDRILVEIDPPVY